MEKGGAVEKGWSGVFECEGRRGEALMADMVSCGVAILSIAVGKRFVAVGDGESGFKQEEGWSERAPGRNGHGKGIWGWRCKSSWKLNTWERKYGKGRGG